MKNFAPYLQRIALNAFVVTCRLFSLFFLQINVSGTSNGVDQDQERHSVGPDLGQKLFANFIS